MRVQRGIANTRKKRWKMTIIKIVLCLTWVLTMINTIKIGKIEDKIKMLAKLNLFYVKEKSKKEERE